MGRAIFLQTCTTFRPRQRFYADFTRRFRHNQTRPERNERDVVLAILNASTSKREARAYLSKFDTDRRTARKDNIRLALVNVIGAANLSSTMLDGVCNSLLQLTRLGLLPIVIPSETDASSELLQSSRFVERFRSLNTMSTLVEGAFETDHSGKVKCALPNLILKPSIRHCIPVLRTTVYHTEKATFVRPSRSSLFLSLLEMGESSQNTYFEKVIFIDPAGGIPSVERDAAHVFVNLEQEYKSITKELYKSGHLGFLSTLDIMRECLQCLPRSASGLLTTPEVAAQNPETSRNTLVFHLLTDKPAFSSSLPNDAKSSPQNATTLFKLGIPLQIYRPKQLSKFSINVDALQDLLRDSFGEELDTEHYFERVDGNVLGVAVAGGYDGLAIVTKEKSTKGRTVPYLDKFAVKTIAQGSGGTADIVFKAVTAAISPKEVLWRSRKSNPVNRWVRSCCSITDRVFRKSADDL